MKPSRFRRIALVALFFIAVAVSLLALWKPFLEEWHLRRLESPDREVNEHAALRLGELKCYRAIPRIALLNFAASDGFQEPPAYERALEMLSGPPSVPYLIQILEDRDGQYSPLRLWAANRLSAFTRSGTALLALGTVLSEKEEDAELRSFAAGALPGFGLPAVPFLLAVLRDDELGHKALDGLSGLGPLAKAAVPELLEGLVVSDEIPLDGDRLAAIERTGWDVLSIFREYMESGGPENRHGRASLAEALPWVTPDSPELIRLMARCLESGDVVLATKAANVLWKFGKTAVPLLIEALKGGNQEVCLHTVMILGWMGKDAVEAVPALEELTRHPDEEVRGKALWALAEVGGDPKGYADLLATSLEKGDEGTRIHALKELVRLGVRAKTAAPALLKELQTGSSEVRIWAACALAKLVPEDPSSVRALLNILESGDQNTKRQALRALGEIGSAAEEVIPVLNQFIHDEDLWETAVESLSRSGSRGMRLLLDILKVPGNHRLHAHIKDCLTTDLPDGKAVPLLIEALEHPDSDIRSWAASSLGELGTAALPAVDTLARLLSGGDDELAKTAATALGALGPGASRAIGALERAMNRDDYPQMAVQALSKMGSPAVPILIKALDHKNPLLRAAAARALGTMGPDAVTAIPVLIRLLKDEEPAYVRFAYLDYHAVSRFPVGESAAVALGDLGPLAFIAVPALVESLDSRSVWIAVASSRALGKMGAAAVPEARKALGNSREEVRGLAAFALGWIGPAAKAAVPDLKECLGDPSEFVRICAAEALGRMGPEAREALPAIEALAQEKSKALRMHARLAAKNISVP